MPAFVLHVPVDLDELFENRAVTANTLSGETRRVVKVTVNVVIMLVVRVLRSEEGRA